MSFSATATSLIEPQFLPVLDRKRRMVDRNEHKQSALA